MKEISLFTYIKKHIEDDYAMNVLYYSVKKAFAERNFTLHGFSYFFIDGRFLGESLKVTSKGNHRTTIHSLSFLLSLRLLILDHKYLDLCNDDNLIIMSKPKESFQWMVYMTLIMDNWDDEEVKMLFGLMEDFYYDEELSEDDKTDFKNSLVCPKYQNERKYYKYLAQKINGISEKIIGNNAFFEADIEKYTISKDIVYVGNTAFSYCENLVSLEFESKVMFGTFPIIECDNLKQIIVPDGLKSYYAECLPYYKSIISEKNSPACENKIEDEINHCDTKRELDDSGVEHVYVGIPSAEPYTETELPSQEIDSKVSSKEERGPIDFSTLQKVFEKKATSYKYFWMMAIISLAKKNKRLTISFEEITIRMATMAWSIVFEDEIDLGSSDMLKKYLEEVTKMTSLIPEASSSVVETYLTKHYSSEGIDKVLAPLMKNVPYRFLSPWVKFTTNEEVIEKSCSKDFDGLYALYSDHIVIDEEWWRYIDTHYMEICDFAVRSFLTYAKKYNNDLKLVKLMTTGWQLLKK